MSEAPQRSTTYRIALEIEGQSFTAEFGVPDREVTLLELLPLLWEFQDALIQAWTDLATPSGKRVSCRKGCGACCRQLVPVSEVEALHLAGVVAGLPADARARVTERFANAVAQLERKNLLAAVADLTAKSPEERRRLGMDYFNERIACPFLEDESCSIHAERPSACREYLVTSPAANCARPTPETVATVRHSARFSEVLFTFGDQVEAPSLSALPLILILARRPADRPWCNPRAPAPRLFEEFLRRLQVSWERARPARDEP